mgnify:CR=1 FL=1
MSLVAYGSSDESGGSDLEDGETAVSVPKPTGIRTTPSSTNSSATKFEPAVKLKDAPTPSGSNNTGQISDDADHTSSSSTYLLKGRAPWLERITIVLHRKQAFV